MEVYRDDNNRSSLFKLFDTGKLKMRPTCPSFPVDSEIRGKCFIPSFWAVVRSFLDWRFQVYASWNSLIENLLDFIFITSWPSSFTVRPRFYSVFLLRLSICVLVFQLDGVFIRAISSCNACSLMFSLKVFASELSRVCGMVRLFLFVRSFVSFFFFRDIIKRSRLSGFTWLVMPS